MRRNCSKEDLCGQVCHDAFPIFILRILLEKSNFKGLKHEAMKNQDPLHDFL